MKKSLIPVTFWALVAVFLLTAGEFCIPAVRELVRGRQFLILPIIFSLLGAVLLIFTLVMKIRGLIGWFLLLTGGSAAGFFVFILLHNMFYALGTISSQIAILSYLMEIIHAVFFFASIFVCPLGFLIGAIGSIILFIKKKF